MPQKPDDKPAKTPEEQLAALQSQLEKATKDLEKLTGERDAFKNDLDMAMKLVRLDSTDEEAVEALRYTMGKAGYSHAEIEDYIQAQTEGAQKQTPPQRTTNDPTHPDGAPKPTRTQAQGADPALLEGIRAVLGEFASEIKELRGQVQAVNSRTTRSTAHDLRERIDSQISETLDSNQTLSMILKRIDGDGKTSAKDSLKKELLLHTREQLNEAARSKRELTPSVVKEAVTKAAAEVGTRYRTVIGDPSTLGRTPETVAEQQRFLNEKPVEAPNFDPEKDTLSDIRARSREWGADALRRDVAAASTEESVV